MKIEMFANRLLKNHRHYAKWARRRGIGCYRVYDKDIPEFPLVIDRYEGKVHLMTARGGEVTEEILETVARVLEVSPGEVRCKDRPGLKDFQYAKTGEEGEFFTVGEGGHRFRVNLDAYIDTGLFLDHRVARGMIEEKAAGKRFLNLFSYTGSFTVYAAKGGAVGSTTVDLSNTYLDWARQNFELNGLDPARHLIVRADVTQWLKEAVARGEQYDLIVLDPPTFSNSKKMIDVFDVQRDHLFLIDHCMRLLAPNGELFFSNNLRTFKLDESIPARYAVQELSARTVPEDFRNRKIHRSWLIRQQ